MSNRQFPILARAEKFTSGEGSLPNEDSPSLGPKISGAPRKGPGKIIAQNPNNSPKRHLFYIRRGSRYCFRY